jgi:SAM-dependent methyltransferase
VKATGERVTTAEGGFNPTFQRHVAAYRQCSALLPDGLVLDLGCGVGHSFHLLAPRPSLGIDVDAEALREQQRPVACADMRRIPLRDGSVGSLFSNQSIEHVPDPGRVLDESARLVAPAGTAVFVTPNRLTFARASEIIDPWHYIEFDARQLRQLCSASFREVQILGIFGSPRYLAFQAKELVRLDRFLRLDPLRMRRLVPRRGRQWAYSLMLNRSRRVIDPEALMITEDDFHLAAEDVDASLDLVAVCREPLPRVGAR